MRRMALAISPAYSFAGKTEGARENPPPTGENGRTGTAGQTAAGDPPPAEAPKAMKMAQAMNGRV
jgi:hypothetical protein